MKLSRSFISATREMSTLFDRIPAPYLRKVITVSDDIIKAELSVCGLGFYRFWLNGTELTRGLLSPYISAPDDILDYDVYDLTDRLVPGKSVLGFQLGNGMQNAFGGYVWDFEKAPWRSAPKLAICLELTAKDGTVTRIEADESFVCAPSPVISDDLRQGECYDARLEIPGWNLPEFDDSSWSPAIAVEAPRGKGVVCEAHPIVKTRELTPVAIRPNTELTFAHNDRKVTGYLYDFGENWAGIARLKIQGRPGQKLGMIFGEFVNDEGVFSVDNIRFVRPEYYDLPLYIQENEYTCKGEGIETWTPGFTYHGFRYALVWGIDPEQATEDLLTYLVMNTDLPERGSFRCSDEVLNKLQDMTLTATLANFYHFPTDCPHREKNGWTADAALSTEHTLLNFDAADNYYEWMRHIRASLEEAGNFPSIVPTANGWGNDVNPAWDQILIHLPYMVYRFTGRRDIVEEALPEIWRYINLLISVTDSRGLVCAGLGDWCAPYEPRTPLLFTTSVVCKDICEKAAFLFEQFGRHAQAAFCQSLSEGYRNAIRRHLIDWSTYTAIGCNSPHKGSQSSQAIAIYYNIFNEDEKPAAFRVLLEKLHEENDHLDTGVLGARVIFFVLTQFGHSDLAHKIMVDPTYPSYGHWVARGETALCEDFNRYDQRISSLNHHFWGSISAWFIQCISGIHFNPNADDIHRADITPHFIESLTHAQAHHDCPNGRIEVEWHRTAENQIDLTLTFPQGMHGNVVLEGQWADSRTRQSVIPAESRTYHLIKL